MEATQEIVLKNGQFVRRTTSEISLGSQDVLLNQLVDQQPVMMPNFMTFNCAPLHLLISKTAIVIATELKKLPFHTWWAIDPNSNGKILNPVFHSRRGSIKIDDP